MVLENGPSRKVPFLRVAEKAKPKLPCDGENGFPKKRSRRKAKMGEENGERKK
jgi:hypothetical protein